MASFNKFGKNTASAAKGVHSQVRATAAPTPNTVNRAGGQAFTQKDKQKLLFLLITSFVEDQFYRTANTTLAELKALIAKNPLFAAKAAIYARTEFGMRSITHAAGAEIAALVKGEQWTKHFFNRLVYRVDDASEILAAYLHLYGKPIPNSLKKGLALSMGKFDRYQISKYKGGNDAVKLVDLFNLVHPKPSEQQITIFKDLIEGNLASTDTWEAKISEAGKQKDKEGAKTAAWKELLTENKLGYFALLRNARNLLGTNDEEVVDLLCNGLVNEKAIKKSLVLPFRYMTAYKEIADLPSTKQTRNVITAISRAMDIALSNVPAFSGNTLVALDCSGSMNGKPIDIGSQFAAVLAKGCNADMLMFDTSVQQVKLNYNDSTITLVEELRKRATGGGTNFNLIFEHAKVKYDRIIILSDMQFWVGRYSPQAAYLKYCQTFKANPKIYNFDLQGYGTLGFPADSVFQLAGFSEKTLELIGVLEKNPDAMLQQVEAIEF